AVLTDMGRFSLQPDDILFNNTNSAELVGKTALFRGHSEAVVYSNHFTRLRTRPQLATPDYVSRWLLSQWQTGAFSRKCNRWIGQSAVKNDNLLSLELPLPGLEEQKRIGSLLESQLQEVERARVAAEDQLAAAKSFMSASLRELFSERASSMWPRHRIDE